MAIETDILEVYVDNKGIVHIETTEKELKTATKVRDLDTIQPHQMAALYKLSDRLEGFDYVVVSAVLAPYTHETYIFGADENGDVLEWGELPGSERDVYSHEKALNNAGYEVK